MPGKKGKGKERSHESELKKLIELRKEIAEHRPDFVRQESWRFGRIRTAWKKPKGIDSKMRKRVKGWPRIVSIGYRGPVKARSLHPSGRYEVVVTNLSGLEKLVPGRDVARIGATVGARKRVLMLNRAKELGLTIVNPRGLRFIEPKK